MNLKLFHGTDAIVRMGSGVFTGCRLEKVEIDFMDGNKSCLKEILTEIRYQIIATLRYQGTETKILFPEYYADAVENTPARIVETHYYGSGGEYRECFYNVFSDSAYAYIQFISHFLIFFSSYITFFKDMQGVGSKR